MTSFCLYCGSIITPMNYKDHGTRNKQCIANLPYWEYHGWDVATRKMDWSNYSRRVRELLQ